jgi:hypothetical protein
MPDLAGCYSQSVGYALELRGSSRASRDIYLPARTAHHRSAEASAVRQAVIPAKRMLQKDLR